MLNVSAHSLSSFHSEVCYLHWLLVRSMWSERLSLDLYSPKWFKTLWLERHPFPLVRLVYFISVEVLDVGVPGLKRGGGPLGKAFSVSSP